MTQTLEEIGYFRTTDRGFGQILHFSDLSVVDIEALPIDALILEVGSGISQTVAREIKSLRPDITTISLDPTILLGANRKFDTYTKRRDSGELKQVEYVLVNENNILQDSSKIRQRTHEERVSQARSTRNVLSALAPDLPFAGNSFHLLIDSFGPFMYLTDQELSAYLQNIVRILTVGGEARIFPINPYSEATSTVESIDQRNTEIKNKIQGMLAAIPGIDFEFFEKEEPHSIRTAKGDEQERRVGVKIKKETT